MSNRVWIIDTSVLCELLPVPGKSSAANRQKVKKDFEKRLKNNDKFLLPYSVLIEVGNHIGHANGDRYKLAEKFINQFVHKTLTGEVPWTLMKVPDIEKVNNWLKNFPESAANGKGYTDHTIIKEWEEFRELNQGFSVCIWSLDDDLAGYGNSSD